MANFDNYITPNKVKLTQSNINSFGASPNPFYGNNQEIVDQMTNEDTAEAGKNSIMQHHELMTKLAKTQSRPTLA